MGPVRLSSPPGDVLMSASTSPIRRADRIPLAILAVTILFAGASQVAGHAPSSPFSAADVHADVPADVPIDVPVGPSDLERVRANIAFWSGRSRANTGDFVSSTRWAAAEVDLARATGDVTRYLAAEEALDAALDANPD